MALNWLPYCACGHAATAHTVHPAGCLRDDSYGFRCACPSFALSQECEERARDSGETAAVEQFLTGLGLDPKARQ